MKKIIKLSLAILVALTTHSAMCAMQVSEDLKRSILELNATTNQACIGTASKVAQRFDINSIDPDEIKAVHDAGMESAHVHMKNYQTLLAQLPKNISGDIRTIMKEERDNSLDIKKMDTVADALRLITKYCNDVHARITQLFYK